MQRFSIYDGLFILLLIGFFCFEIQFFHLAFLFDELWVYGPAVQMMAKNGPSLLPNVISPDLYRGHPLLFHFLFGWWIKLFGNSIETMRLFALLISTSLCILVYRFASELVNKKMAFFAVLILLMQPVFLAQASMVLPEVLLAFFSVGMVYAYWKGGFSWKYLAFSILLILTKESGIVLVIILVGYHILVQFFAKAPWRQLLIETFKGSLALLVFGLFLGTQKMYQGWFLYPEHIGYIELDFFTFIHKLVIQVSNYLFIWQGRNFLFLSALIALIYIVYKKINIPNKNILFLLTLLMIGFSGFSALNFFTNRYLLCVIPFYIIATMILLEPILKNNYLYVAIILLFIGTQYLYVQKKDVSDNTLGFKDCIELNQKWVDYCIEQSWQHEKVWAFFVSRYALGWSSGKYLTPDQEFSQLPILETEPNIKYYIISNVDFSESMRQKFNDDTNLKRIKRIEHKNLWAEIYARK